MIKILYDTFQIRKEIISLFSSTKGQRVAITAFVGIDADKYLPNPKGMQLICWPKAGGTNPDALRQLKQRGVKIYFADRLHMKLYWAENRGAIITSANLSTSALGAGDLKEVGVFIYPHKVDIDKIISSIKKREMSVNELYKLQKSHDLIPRKRGPEASSIKFPQWYRSFAPRRWKLGWYDSQGSFSMNAIKVVKKDYGVKPHDFISCKRKDYCKGDWVLMFSLNKNSTIRPEWLFVDYIIQTSRKDSKAYETDYPFQAVQANRNNVYPRPPFNIDFKFSSVFKRAIKDFGVKRIKQLKSQLPPKKLIDFINKYYR